MSKQKSHVSRIMHFRSISPQLYWNTLVQAASNWSANRTGRMAAALAYFSIFSLGPLLLIVTSVAGLVYGQAAVQGKLTAELQQVMGKNGAMMLETLLANASKTSSGALGTIMGIIFLLLAALGVVVQLKDAFNKIWRADNSPNAVIWWYVQTYAGALAGVLAVGFLLVVTLVLSAGLNSLSGLDTDISGIGAMRLLNFVLSLIVLSAMFAMMFRWLPDTDVPWNSVIPGAVLTAILFSIGKYLIGWYVGTQSFSSTYGAAASLIVLLVWVYYSSSIVLFGAEITHAYEQVSETTQE